MRSKRGFEMAMTTLVVIILSVVVLSVLIITFTGGWKKLWGNMEQLTPSDMEVVKSACKSACNSGLTNDFCCRQREISLGTKKTMMNCTDLRLNIECNINCDSVC